MSDIVAYAAGLFKLTPDVLLEDRRAARYCYARTALYAGLWLRAELRGRTPRYKEIGRIVGGRDHSTIIHGMKNAQKLMETDAKFLEAVLEIATVSEQKLQRREEAYCKFELQMLRQLHQQRNKVTRPMGNPEYTEKKINEALAALRGARGVEVYWDGDVVAPGEPANFTVYNRAGDETPYYITDEGVLVLYASGANRSRDYCGEARTFEGIAKRLAEVAANDAVFHKKEEV